jgi:hypothetical protein
MKRIILLVCGMLFLVSSTAEARFFRRGGGSNYNTSYTSTTRSAPAVAAGHSTSTAQGVAQIMASTGTVGHWGGNPGYEGCGAGATQAAAYNNCCYANSGMTTVDVGYARGASGMWFCCRRYR